MNKFLQVTAFVCASSMAFGQAQIGNSGFESWEAVASDEEPINWNSFLSASGSFSWAAGNQIASSTDVRPGSAGTKSCNIWSNSTLGIIANGNVTLGQINMGSTTPSSSSNYNYSKTADANFSETLTDTPDSIVFWVKFVPNGHTQNARMKATLHGNYDYRDPEDAGSSAQVVATAVLNFPPTSNAWVRKAIAFNYSGPATVNSHILVTFTTNETAGGGADDDQLYIDDVELIYNPNSLNAIDKGQLLSAFLTDDQQALQFSSNQPINGNYEVYDLNGKQVMSGAINGKQPFYQPAGMYIVKATIGQTVKEFKIVKH